MKLSPTEVFTKRFFDPRLRFFSVPDDALVKIVLKGSSKLLLFLSGEDRWCPAVPVAGIFQAIEA